MPADDAAFLVGVRPGQTTLGRDLKLRGIEEKNLGRSDLRECARSVVYPDAGDFGAENSERRI